MATEVAIKVLLPNAAMKPDLVARFEREAQITASDRERARLQVARLTSSDRAGGAHLLIFEAPRWASRSASG